MIRLWLRLRSCLSLRLLVSFGYGYICTGFGYLEASLVGVLFHAALVPAGRVPRQRLLPELAALLRSLNHPLVLSLPQTLPPVHAV